MKLKEKLKNIKAIYNLWTFVKGIYYNVLYASISNISSLLRKHNFVKNGKYKSLKKYKDIHKEDRCFIVATGPSLTFNDLSKLKNEFCFGMNSIIKILDEVDWKPTYYGIQDYNVYQHIEDEIFNSKLENVFVSQTIKSYFKIPFNAKIFPLNYLGHRVFSPRKKHFTKFSSNIFETVYDGYTITYSLIQIAVYMGFKEIYLLGCDTNYKKNPDKNYFVKSGHVDPNSNTVAERMLYAYSVAKDYADSHGVKILNATRGGMLEVFERVDFDKIITKYN